MPQEGFQARLRLRALRQPQQSKAEQTRSSWSAEL